MADRAEIRVPDIGDFEDVEVVEILVAPGDRVEIEDPLVSIESDKATMEIPASAAGVVAEVCVALGDRVSEGTLMVVLQSEAGAGVDPSPDGGAGARPEPAVEAPALETPAEPATPLAMKPPPEKRKRAKPVPATPDRPGHAPHASPLVRRQARELGVDLEQASGSGPRGRIVPEDVKRRVREVMEKGGGAGIPAVPDVDFSQFGPTHEQPLPRIRQVSARNLSRSWLNLPHVTQHDEADVGELETYRRSLRERAAEWGVRISLLPFVMKALVSVLRELPDLRASLAPGGEALVVKDYYHLGIAVDTENGLVVPVVRDVEQKGVIELAKELAALAEKARARKLSPSEIQGACFTISNLGGIGGTAFTPIVNAPEVAILGLSKLSVKPVWSARLDPSREGGGAFEPRLMLPLSLSYDHRVIDGAVAARFTTRLCELLAHPANLLL